MHGILSRASHWDVSSALNAKSSCRKRTAAVVTLGLVVKCYITVVIIQAHSGSWEGCVILLSWLECVKITT